LAFSALICLFAGDTELQLAMANTNGNAANINRDGATLIDCLVYFVDMQLCFLGITKCEKRMQKSG